MKSLALTLAVVLAVCGCTTGPPPTASARAAAEQTAAVTAALASERQWLGSWFQGTPVAIDKSGNGAVTVDVPREFCFEPRKSSVKPALAAVLDKVAESLRRVPLAQLTLLAAPDDAAGSAPLALQRADQVREYLRSRGVPPVRLGKPSAAAAAAVQLRIEAPPT